MKSVRLPPAPAGPVRRPTRNQDSPQNAMNRVLRLQRAVGNRVVTDLLRSPGAVVQRRGENPYAASGDHGGWSLTAHHIVAHATITGLLDQLDPAQKKEVLVHSVPRSITSEMAENLKVKVPDGPPEAVERFLFALHADLVNPATDEEKEVGGQKIRDIRESFFEWQGGNQFLGPNTSIRPEPADDKTGIDRDARYFFPQYADQQEGSVFKQLTGIGEQLRTLEKANKGKGAEAISAGDKADITTKLKEMLNITKDLAPRPFDPSRWMNVGSITDFEAVASSQALSREGHISKYGYLQFEIADIEANKWPNITKASDGYRWFGEPIALQQSGPKSVFISIEAARNKIAKAVETSMKTHLEVTLGLEVKLEEKAAAIPLHPDLTVEQKKLKVANYVDAIPLMAHGAEGYKVALAIYTKRVLKPNVAPKSLYESLKSLEGVTPKTLCFLPKELYNEVAQETGMPGVKAPEPFGLNRNAIPFYPKEYMADPEKYKAALNK